MRSAPFDVTVRGPGDPEVVVVGGVHGDETGGVEAVRRLRTADLDLQRGVAFVLANPSAIDAGKRYLNADLNRVFPGDPEGNYEERLAAHLCRFIDGRTTLSLHGTHSEPTPFALVHRAQPREFEIVDRLPVPYVVEYSAVDYGTITRCGMTVEIEVGALGTEDAAISAEQQARAFLRAVGALPGEPPLADPAYFRMSEPIPKPPGTEYAVHARNFDRVTPGMAFASVDGEPMIAEDAFYPILLSANGYPDIFGYKGSKVGDSMIPSASGTESM